MNKVKLPNRLFVTGTDTDVGKTIISSILAKGLEADYFKPIQTGDDLDRDEVRKLTNLSKKKIINEVYKLKDPLSPYAAARNEKTKLDVIDILQLYKSIKSKRVVVEGAGGVMVPILKNYFMSDLIKSLGLSCVIVGRSGLGTINHTLLTIEHLKRKNIEILCIVMNGERNISNEDIIEKISGIKVVSVENIDLGRIENLDKIFNDNFVIK